MISGKQISANCVNANESQFERSVLITPQTAECFDAVNLEDVGKTALHGAMVANFTDNGKRRFLVAPNTHSLIVGGTGSGKTECFFLNQVDLAARCGEANSMFVMDLKGTIYEQTADTLRDNGYKVFVLNFKEPFSSMHYNPLSSIYKNYREAKDTQKLIKDKALTYEFLGVKYRTQRECTAAAQRHAMVLFDKCQTDLKNIAKILVPIESTKDVSWDYGSRDAVYLILWGMLEDSDYPERGMTEDKFTLYNLGNIAYCVQDDCFYINQWTASRPFSSDTRRLGAYYNLSAKQTRDSYISCINNKLNRYSCLPINVITAKSDIEIGDIAKALSTEKVAIFCMTDETRVITYDLCMMFVTQLLSALQYAADNSKNKALTQDFHFYLDEFANMPQLPDAEKWISTMRSRRVWLHLGIQSYDQLSMRYGDKVQEIILDNCDTQIFFGCNNQNTIEKFSRGLGEKCGAITGYGVNNNGDVSANISPTNVPLVKKSDLCTLKLGEAYVKTFRNPPMFSYLEPHFKCADLSHGRAVPPIKSESFDSEDCYYNLEKLYAEGKIKKIRPTGTRRPAGFPFDD